jgi:hypothetical protein
MAERHIIQDTDGRWVVRTPGCFVSVYDRKSDALARATTGLSQTGGGFWILRDANGRELDRGEVSGLTREPFETHPRLEL